MTAFFLITTISIASAAAPATAGIINYRSLEREFKLLLGLFMIVVLVEGYSYFAYLNNTNIHWVHHIYAPLEYGFIAVVFSFWQKSEIVKKSLIFSIPIFTLICVVNMLLPNSMLSLNSLTASLACTIYVLISVYTLYNLQKKDIGQLHKDSRFWICAALLLFSSGDLAYFAFDTFLANAIGSQLYYIHSSLNITANILYSIGFFYTCRL
jgi:hypothetical protein